MIADNKTDDKEQAAPLVFLSHAREDKGRFVLEFARLLRENGINVWFDDWEMQPGDSLVDKIFEEGIRNARAIIIVLSEASVTKKWVREELNAAVVRRLAEGTTLIPVVIDDCEVPESLKSTVWVRIENLAEYAPELDRIVAAVFNRREKPPIGRPPGYAAILDRPVAGLNRIDTRILMLFADEILKPKEFLEFHADTDPIRELAESQGIPQEEFLDSLQVLEDERYLESSMAMAPVSPFFTLTLNGFKRYAESYLPNFGAVVMEIASLVVNEGTLLNLEIEERLGYSKTLVAFVLKSMERRGYVKISNVSGGRITIWEVKPQLRRALSEESLA